MPPNSIKAPAPPPDEAAQAPKDSPRSSVGKIPGFPTLATATIAEMPLSRLDPALIFAATLN